MVHLKPGDRVNCRVKNCEIVVAYDSYDEIKTFEIVSTNDEGYYLFVPNYYVIKGTLYIDERRCDRYDINPCFLGENMVYIDENMVYTVSSLIDGMCCVRCQDFYSMSQPNQEDGQTFVCWSCRKNPYH